MDVELVRVVYLYSPYYLYFSCNKDREIFSKNQKFSLKIFCLRVKSFGLRVNFWGQIFLSGGQILYTNYITN